MTWFSNNFVPVDKRRFEAMKPAVEKFLSHSADVAGTPKYFLANSANLGHLEPCSCQIIRVSS